MFFKTKNFPSTCIFLVFIFLLTPTSLAKEYNESEFIEELQNNPIESLSDLTPFQWASITRYLASKVQMSAIYEEGLDYNNLRSRALDSLDPNIKTPFFRYLYKDMLCGLNDSKWAINSLDRESKKNISIWKKRITEFNQKPEKINYKDTILDAQTYFVIGEIIAYNRDHKEKPRQFQEKFIKNYKRLFLQLMYSDYRNPNEGRHPPARSLDRKVIFDNMNLPFINLAEPTYFLMANSVQIFMTSIALKRISYDGLPFKSSGSEVTDHDYFHRMQSLKVYKDDYAVPEDSIQLLPKNRLIYYQAFQTLDPDQIDADQHRKIFTYNRRNAEITEKFLTDMRKNKWAILALFHQIHEVTTEHRCAFYLDWKFVYSKYSKDPRCQDEVLVEFYGEFIDKTLKSDRINQPFWMQPSINPFAETVELLDPDTYKKRATSGITDVKDWVMKNKALIFSEDQG